MSLLLLFKPGGQQWTKVLAEGTTWSLQGGDFKHLWSDWNTTQWGYFNSNGLSWAFIQGLTFANTAANASTVWTKVNPPS